MQYAMILKAQGQLSQAWQLDNELLDFAERHRLSQTGMTGAVLTEMGDILGEQGRCEQGIAMIGKGIELAKKTGTTMIRWLSYTNLTKAYIYQGSYTEAQRTIHDTFDLLKKDHLASWYLAQTSALQGRCLLFRDDLRGASQWAEQRQLSPEAEMTHIHEQEYLVYARLLIAQKHYDVALDLLDRMLAIAEPDTRIRAAIEMHLLKGIAQHYKKQTDAVVREVGRALTLAEEGGYISLFLMEGPLAVKLIQDTLAGVEGTCSRSYIQRIIDAFPDIPHAVKHELSPDALSEREIDVLCEVAQGFSNKEISERLCISLNTVKSHMKQIFSKLNVKNRTEAVRRGRELGVV
jgi:LuxR family maltose regulon positive regulatory protein